MKVLLVDDEVDLAEIIQSYLKRKGCEAIIAHDKKSALTFIAEGNDFSWLVCDFNLADGKGTEIAEVFSNKYQSGKVCLMSGDPEIGNSVNLNENYHFIGKPFTGKDIFNLIKSVA